MKVETIENYRSNINFLRRIAFVSLIIQMVIASFHLFVPSIIEGGMLSLLPAIAIGIVANLVGLLMAARIVDLEGTNLIKVYRFIAIIGLYHQYFSGINTIYTITIYVIAVIAENIIIPKLEMLQRTQNFASHEKLTQEVYQAIVHADHYLEKQIKWVVNSLILLLVVAIISIFMITLVNILPLLVPNVTIIQYLGVAALLILVGTIVYTGFPEIEQTATEYDLN